MKLSTRIIVALVGFICLIGAAILWDNYNDLYIAIGFLGVLLLGFAGTTEGEAQIKD